MSEEEHMLQQSRDVLQELAGTFQRMAELARAVEERAGERQPAIAWWAKGQAEALELAADQARELAAPTVTVRPAKAPNAMLSAYKACMAMYMDLPAEAAAAEAPAAEEVVEG